MEAFELKVLDDDFYDHRQAFLNFAVQAEKKAGRGKTRPVYRRFDQFFDYEKELEKLKNRKKKSKFSGLQKYLKEKGG